MCYDAHFRYVKEYFMLTDYSSNDHITRSVLSIKEVQKKVAFGKWMINMLVENGQYFYIWGVFLTGPSLFSKTAKRKTP